MNPVSAGTKVGIVDELPKRKDPLWHHRRRAPPRVHGPETAGAVPAAGQGRRLPEDEPLGKADDTKDTRGTMVRRPGWRHRPGLTACEVGETRVRFSGECPAGEARLGNSRD